MKNYIFCSFLFLSFSITVHGQAFSTGTNVISGGLGFLNWNIHKTISSSATPQFSLQYERGLWKVGPGVISLGVVVGEISYETESVYPGQPTAPTKRKWNYWDFGVRGAYHFTGLKIPKLDTYAGVMVGDQQMHYTATTYDGSTTLNSNGRTFSVFAGARYFIWSRVGPYFELANGPFFNGGVAVKL